MGEQTGEIKRIPAEENPWYWIYKRGQDTWNAWTNGNLGRTVEQEISTKIKQHCNTNTGTPNRHHKIDFSNTIFSDNEMNFNGFLFPNEVTFENSVLKCKSTFVRSIFKEEIIFQDCEFKGSVNFTECHFNKASLFIDAKFRNQVDFKNSAFNGMARFDRCIFAAKHQKMAVFTGIKFDQSLNLEGAKFYQSELSQCMIDLRGSVVGGDLVLPLKNLLRLTPKSNEHEQWAKLKLEMNGQHLHQEEMDFFAKELECRALTGDKKQRIIIYLYREIADYGRSASKPFVVLCGLCLVMTIPYAFFYDIGTPSSLYKAINVSLDNSFPFSLIKDKEASGFAFNLLAVIHKTIATILLFLIGFAIRNRLRIK